MAPEKELIRLRHILDHSREAIELAEGHSQATLETTRILQLCLCRLVEIIGEATTHISDRTRAKYPSIPWLDIVGMRNRIIHGYDEINFEILWKTVSQRIPQLVPLIEHVLQSESAEGN